MSQLPRLDAVVVGAGLAGMYALHRLRDRVGLHVRALEAGHGVGGTWYWNRYPGARCDSESLYYSYSFDEGLQADWTWSERYAGQPEILAYAEHVAERFDLYRDITFGTRVESARFDESAGVWQVSTDSGDRYEARYLVTAVGCLSAPQSPDLPGAEDFTGQILHTSRWPEEGVDLDGKRVVVVGTGSTGIQITPEVAQRAAHTTVLQRTANFAIPSRNRPYAEGEFDELRAEYPRHRKEALASAGGFPLPAAPESAEGLDGQQRRAEMDQRWRDGGLGFLASFADALFNRTSNDAMAEYVRERIRETVHDPATAELLCPDDHPIGSKRICVESGYHAVFNRDDVSLVSVRENPVEGFTPAGIVAGGTEHQADVVVMATGFDAITGPYLRMDLRGRGGVRLADRWAQGPRTYLGVATAEFPNLFMLTGPGSPSVLGNVMVSIEQHVEWVSDYIAHLDAAGVRTTEPEASAEQEWTDHVAEIASFTFYPEGGSWYTGANTPGKPRTFMPYAAGMDVYRQRCSEVAEQGYPGFVHA